MTLLLDNSVGSDKECRSLLLNCFECALNAKTNQTVLRSNVSYIATSANEQFVDKIAWSAINRKRDVFSVNELQRELFGKLTFDECVGSKTSIIPLIYEYISLKGWLKGVQYPVFVNSKQSKVDDTIIIDSKQKREVCKRAAHQYFSEINDIYDSFKFRVIHDERFQAVDVEKEDNTIYSLLEEYQQLWIPHGFLALDNERKVATLFVGFTECNRDSAYIVLEDEMLKFVANKAYFSDWCDVITSLYADINQWRVICLFCLMFATDRKCCRVGETKSDFDERVIQLFNRQRSERHLFWKCKLQPCSKENCFGLHTVERDDNSKQAILKCYENYVSPFNANGRRKVEHLHVNSMFIQNDVFRATLSSATSTQSCIKIKRSLLEELRNSIDIENLVTIIADRLNERKEPVRKRKTVAKQHKGLVDNVVDVIEDVVTIGESCKNEDAKTNMCGYTENMTPVDFVTQYMEQHSPDILLKLKKHNKLNNETICRYVKDKLAIRECGLYVDEYYLLIKCLDIVAKNITL